jgi:hypothetical protein
VTSYLCQECLRVVITADDGVWVRARWWHPLCWEIWRQRERVAEQAAKEPAP